MFTINRKAIALARNPYPYRIGILFTHRNDDFGAISATERSCAAPISRVELHLSNRFYGTLLCSKNSYSDCIRSE